MRLKSGGPPSAELRFDAANGLDTTSAYPDDL